MVSRTLWWTALALLGVVLMGWTAAAVEEKEAAALDATQSWLALVDQGEYGESWVRAAVYFKNAISRDQWNQSLHAVRRPLGEVLSRTLKSRTFLTELPGAPDGQYVVIQFDTSFENKRSAVETVTPMLEQDGAWRVAGYFIR